MKKFACLVFALLAISVSASARNVVLVAHHQRSAAGVLSTLVWKDCGPTGPYTAPCLNPNNAWVVANGVTPATATWDWDPVNRVLTGSGLYWATTHISSNPNGSSVVSDKVVDLRIDALNGTTTATAYDCVEGNFVAGVGSNACGNYRLGDNFVDESALTYNVGGDANCMQRVLSGDDTSIGNPRGLADRFGGGGCHTADGGFEQYTVVQDNLDTGGTLILSNGICIGAPGQGTDPPTYGPCANANFMTFEAVAGPYAGGDTATTEVNTPVTINILANDGGFISPVTVTISADPANGTAVVNGSPGDPAQVNVNYTPAAGFRGSDTFEYTVTDGVASHVATVTVSVGLTPSYYPSGPRLNVALSTIAGGGWTQCYSAPMSASIGYNAENVLSVCQGDYLMMAGRATGSDTFLVAAAARRADAILNTGGGSTTHLANGSNWYFTPNWSWGFTAANDTVSLQSCDVSASSPMSMCLHMGGGGYRINDISNLNSSNQYEKVFFVSSVPGVYGDAATTYLSQPINIAVLANDVGFGDPVTVSITAAPQNGTVTVNGSPGNPLLVNVTYTPNAGFQGQDTFRYFADDGSLSGEATVTVDVDIPYASPDVVLARLATPLTIDVLDNDIGFRDPVTVTVTGDPQHGTAVVTGSPGSTDSIRIVYTPAAGFTGSDSLQYQVSDGVNTASATVSITVAAFWAVDDEYQVLSYSGSLFSVGLNDVGFQDPVTLTILDYPSQGSAHVDYSPGPRSSVQIHFFASGGTYTDTMTYQLSDGVRTDTATVTVHVAPYIAQDDEALTGGGNPVTIPVAQNDLGFNYPRIVGMFTNPQHGRAVANNPDPNYCCQNPTITYTPDAGFFGDDTFEYAIDDGTRVGIATVTVHVINDGDNDQVDDDSDNCVGVANADQRDTDGDLYGNMCDADFDNNLWVNFADLSIFRSRFGTGDPDADFDGNGIVNFADLARLRNLFGKPPGPSALAGP